MVNWDNVPLFGTAPEGEAWVIRPSAYGFIRDDRGRIAVVRNPKGIYLPGGGIDAGETPEDGVIREVMEECGLIVSIGTWRAHAVEFVYSEPERTHFEKRSTFVDCIVEGISSNAVEADHELLWVNVETVSELVLPQSHGWAVEQWRIGDSDQ